MLTAFLRSVVATFGTLTVSTGEDDVRVYVNNRDVGRRTQRGVIRVQALGPVTVRVAKDGFDSPPAMLGIHGPGLPTMFCTGECGSLTFSEMTITAASLSGWKNCVQPATLW